MPIDHPGLDHQVEHPQQTVAIHILRACQMPQDTIAGQQCPAVLHREGKGEAVDERKRWFEAPVAKRTHHPRPVQSLDPQPELTQLLAAVLAQLPFVQQVRDYELHGKAENGFDE